MFASIKQLLIFYHKFIIISVFWFGIYSNRKVSMEVDSPVLHHIYIIANNLAHFGSMYKIILLCMDLFQFTKQQRSS